MRKRNHRKRPIAEINVVPYIDVMLVLLVIFMITTPLLTQGVKIDLPQAQAKTVSQDKQPIIVSVDAAGHYFLNVSNDPNKATDLHYLLTRIAAELSLDPSRAVLIKGDKHVPYGQVVQAMVMLQQAGVDSVGLMTQQPEANRNVIPAKAGIQRSKMVVKS